MVVNIIARIAMLLAIAFNVFALKIPHHLHNMRDMIGSNMTSPEMIEAMGYPSETHYVETEDGYILELHRIPHGRMNNRNSETNRPVAYLQHCLLCSSADFIMNAPDKAIAFQLAERGYDVWLGNFRGNTYSKNHTTLDPKDSKFWQFSWDEMAYYDIPATIDYILKETSQESLYYTGFSMGTTTFIALMSERPEYASKIKVAALMGPAVYMENVKGAFAELAPYSHDLDLMMSLLGVDEFLPSSEFMEHFANTYCGEQNTTSELCYEFLHFMNGPSEGEINTEYLPIMLSHTPAGTSIHTVNHYPQLTISKNFQKYDYGKIMNLEHYGTITPPAYAISNITTPIGLYWSQGDYIATPEDVNRLVNELPNVVVNHEVEKTLFCHMDFAWGLNADIYVYKYIYELFEKY